MAFEPRMAVEDPEGARWLRQATLRLRREVCWLWHQRGTLPGLPGRADGSLPPLVDRLGESLDRARFDEEKRSFFRGDPTAAYLTRLLEGELASPEDGAPAADGSGPPPRGFGRVADELGLEPVDRFVLALALGSVVDAAAAPVVAACANDAGATRPTLALAQRLWDRPEEVAGFDASTHPLVRTGLLSPAPEDWDAPLAVPPAVASRLLFPSRPCRELETLEEDPAAALPPGMRYVAARLATAAPGGQLLPLRGPPGAPFRAAAAAVARSLGSRAVAPRVGATRDAGLLRTLAWLEDAVLHLPFRALDAGPGGHGPVPLPLPALPGLVVVALEDPADAGRLPDASSQPVQTLPPLDHAARVERWTRGLGDAARAPGMAEAVADCARRFRLEAPAVDRLCRVLGALGRPPRPADVEGVCRADVELGELATPVEPRFTVDELMLPRGQSEQIRELIRAAATLTRVHHEWGTARAWRESGLSALFAGPPGTGKTMAAEVVADAVGMPLFRIDLSQVVNKYIGETEKNLRRVFDAADASDVILFFDEADALFGKRTEVKDAHDRYANLEVSYLLERMERFRGVAILATNRKKDLDDAFLRRLRFVVEFPQPGEEERLRIWRTAIPSPVDASDLDLPFLAARFPLSGGYIRSIVFQACLQSAGEGAPRRLEMPVVVKAVRREMEKAGRAVSLELFGTWAPHVRE